MCKFFAKSIVYIKKKQYLCAAKVSKPNTAELSSAKK